MQESAELLEQTTQVYEQAAQLAPLLAVGLICIALTVIVVHVLRNRKRDYYD